ncbi:hypothetical protein T492DRAFT_927037, partial [Pavlovales sp. CCMP2436]
CPIPISSSIGPADRSARAASARAASARAAGGVARLVPRCSSRTTATHARGGSSRGQRADLPHAHTQARGALHIHARSPRRPLPSARDDRCGRCSALSRRAHVTTGIAAAISHCRRARSEPSARNPLACREIGTWRCTGLLENGFILKRR